MTDMRVGFIGLGNMGGRMTQCLIRNGREVLGFDTNAESLRASGTKPAPTPGAVAESSDIVLLSLPNSAIVESVILGEGGLLPYLRSGQIVVDLSTSAPESTRKIHAILQAEQVEYVDAGISGGAAAAEKAALTLMVGGSADALEQAREILDCFASNIYYLGASGAGHTAKILNNFLNAVALSATSEVMIAAKCAGLDLETLLEVFNKSSGVNFATINRFPKIIQGDYLKGGLTNALMMKDVTLYAELLRDLGVPSLHSSGPLSSFGLAIALGYSEDISNTVVDAMGDISGGVRLHDEPDKGGRDDHHPA